MFSAFKLLPGRDSPFDGQRTRYTKNRYFLTVDHTVKSHGVSGHHTCAQTRGVHPCAPESPDRPLRGRHASLRGRWVLANRVAPRIAYEESAPPPNTHARSANPRPTNVPAQLNHSPPRVPPTSPWSRCTSSNFQASGSCSGAPESGPKTPKLSFAYFFALSPFVASV